jgi:hypothetical protein
MGATPYEDAIAGLRLAFPAGWSIVPGDAEEDDTEWLTTAAFPPGPADTARRPEEDDGWEPTWSGIWEEASRPPGERPAAPASPPPGHGTGRAPGGPSDRFPDTDPEGWLADAEDLFSYFGFYVGRWTGLSPEPPGPAGSTPGNDAWAEFVEGADRLATSFLDSWEWFVPDGTRGLDRSARPATVSGHRAAAVRYHYVTDEAGTTAAYLRLLVVQLPLRPPSFVLGVCQTAGDRPLVDACLDSVEVLPDRSNGHPR